MQRSPGKWKLSEISSGGSGRAGGAEMLDAVCRCRHEARLRHLLVQAEMETGGTGAGTGSAMIHGPWPGRHGRVCPRGGDLLLDDARYEVPSEM